MKRKDPSKAAKASRRAALWMGHASCVLVHDGASMVFAGRRALLEFLTGPRPFGQIWLTPHSPYDWRVVLPPLLEAGWGLGVAIRKGICSSVRVYRTGDFLGSEDLDLESGVVWSGRSAAGIVEVPSGLSPREEARATFEAVERLDQMIRGRYPSVTLGTSLTTTALDIFRTYLEDGVQANAQVEVSLRHADAVGGGRQEMFALPGESVVGAIDLDMASAYPTALASGKIGVEYVGPGTESCYGDPNVITFAAVEVPDGLVAGPLRYRSANIEAASCYPTGTVFGAWSGPQIKAAEAAGCRVVGVQEVWSFAPNDAFARFGEEMMRWRNDLRSYSGTLEVEVCKRLAVQAVGGWLMSPRERKIVAGEPDDMNGVRILGHGLYEIPVDISPHKNSLVPAGVMTIGLVQAWSSLVLTGATRKDPSGPIYWHTDGGAFRTREACHSGLDFAISNGAPRLDHWKMRYLRRLQVWAPGQRLEEYEDGTRRVVGSGISRSLGEEEVMRRMRVAEECAEADRKDAGLRIREGKGTRPPRVGEAS